MRLLCVLLLLFTTGCLDVSDNAVECGVNNAEAIRAETEHCMSLKVLKNENACKIRARRLYCPFVSSAQHD